MHAGRTLFSQVMHFVPWTSFERIIKRYDGDAQLTYRESLRDIETCLGAQPAKLYSMGLRQPVTRATLAEANERRNWLIWYDLAQVLIRRARQLYAGDALNVELDNTVYALDSTTIDESVT